LESYVIKKDASQNTITVADVQLVLLSMLKDVDAICKKHNIPYFLNGGSALGAYRHQGFIPWDDDVDIAMMDNDYKRFLEVIVDELKENYVVHAYSLNRCYNVLIPAMKIRKKGTYVKEANKLLMNKCTDSDGLFIDVFVYSYVNKNKVLDLPLRLCNVALMPLIILLENLNVNPIPLKSLFVYNAKLYGLLNRRSDYIGFDLTWTFKNPLKPFIFKKSDIYPTQLMQFEDIKLPVAHNIKEYLKIAIAPSFQQLPPVDQQKPKHIIDVNLEGESP
jgi:lipopolysaccharide cholinephosphotransferase